MNDNDTSYNYIEPPDWVWAIVDKHDLSPRAPDGPLAAVTVLLHDAAFDLQEIATTVFREQALTSSSQQSLRKTIDMLTDAERLSEFAKLSII